MKFGSAALFSIALGCSFAMVGTAQDAGLAADRLKVLQSQFEELRADAFSAQEKFDARYAEELKKLEAKAQSAGKLETVIATRKEAEEFQTRSAVLDKPSPHADLARLQGIYDAQKAQLAAERNEKLKSLVAGYQKQLGDLKVALTKAGDIDGALKVAAVAESVAAEFKAGETTNPTAPVTPPSPEGEKKGVTGRFVRIDLPGKGTFLHIAEVEVYSGKENIARKGKATQASTWVDYPYGQASSAIDGNTNGSLGGNSLAHTSMGDDLWWEVDLGEEQEINRIVVWNREDGLESRLDGFQLSVLDKRHNTEWKKTFATAPREIAVEVGGE